MKWTSDLLDQMKSEHFWKKGEKVVLGVSGGVDSMVLFDVLNRLPVNYKPSLTVAHINHQLRDESDEEERFIREWVGQYDVPIYTYIWDKAMHPDSGVEKEARKIRYAFFDEVAEKTNSSVILTAHHRDDQIETVLMRFVKGSSLDELTGILSTRRANQKRIVRPLLSYSKEQIKQYAIEQSIPWKEDETNQSMDYTRNRYRQFIIPELKKENPAFEQHVYDFSKNIQDVLKVIEPLINDELQRSFHLTHNSMMLNLSTFLKQESGFQKIVLRRAFKELSGQRAYIISQNHIDILIDWFVSGGPNTTIDLPDQFIARKEYDNCFIYKADHTHTSQKADRYLLTLNQWTVLNDQEKIGFFTSDIFKTMSWKDGPCIYLNDEVESEALWVRHREPGDRMTIKGSGGSKKIKDIFIDQKVPGRQRDEAWLVINSQQDIIWLVNHKESSLSVNPLTDTIKYVLAYQKQSMQG